LCCPSQGAGSRIEPGVPSRRGTTWCIGTKAHLLVGIVGEQLALDDVGIDDDLRDVVDRPGRDLCLVEDRHGLGLGVLGDERADDGVELGRVADPIRVGPELGIVR
jgi:hypothetical protein